MTPKEKIIVTDLKQQILANFAKIESIAEVVDLKMEKLRNNVGEIKNNINEKILVQY